MKKLPNGDLIELPVVRVQTADPRNFKDTFMQMTEMDEGEQLQLATALQNYIDE